jgi:hypothetical protein
MASEPSGLSALLTRRVVATSLIIFIVGMAVRVPLDLIAPARGLYNVDELALALIVVDRWLGLPPIDLTWPGIPLQFATFIVFLPKFAWALATDRGLQKLSATIVAHYDDPSSLILTLRLLSSLGGALAAVAAYRIVRQIAESELAALIAAAAVTLIPISLSQSLVGTNDAVALMFAMWAAYGVVGRPAKPVLVGVMSAGVVVTKVAMAVWLLPVILSGATLLFQREGGRAVFAAIIRCALSGIIATVLFFPYLWIEPVRTIKGILGTVLAHTNGQIADASVISLVIPGYYFVITIVAVVVMGVIVTWGHERWRYPAAAIGAVTIALFGLFSITGFDYWRYMLGALVPGVILWAFAATTPWRNVMVSGLSVLTFAFGAIDVAEQTELRRPEVAQPLSESIVEMCQRGETIWMFDGLLAARYHALPLPNATVAEIASYFETANFSHAIGDWLTAAKVNPIAAAALQTDFDERDQAERARWRAMAAFKDSSLDCPFHLFRYGFVGSTSEAQSGYMRGTFTNKSLRDVQADLDSPADAKVIDVIGPADALTDLHLPMRPIGEGMGLAVKKIAQ